jgi:hypothetical protein
MPVGTVDEVDPLVVFLFGDDTSFISGSAVTACEPQPVGRGCGLDPPMARFVAKQNDITTHTISHTFRSKR